MSYPAEAALVGRALRNAFAIQIRLGWADPQGDVPGTDYSLALVNSARHQQLAKEAADQSFVRRTWQRLSFVLRPGLRASAMAMPFLCPETRSSCVGIGNAFPLS